MERLRVTHLEVHFRVFRIWAPFFSECLSSQVMTLHIHTEYIHARRYCGDNRGSGKHRQRSKYTNELAAEASHNLEHCLQGGWLAPPPDAIGSPPQHIPNTSLQKLAPDCWQQIARGNR
eukprot:8367305-Pyramimonas_sp.AAC.3